MKQDKVNINAIPELNLQVDRHKDAKILMFAPKIIHHDGIKATLLLHGWLYEENTKVIFDPLIKIISPFMSPEEKKIFKVRSKYFKVNGVDSTEVKLYSPWQTTTTKTEPSGHFYFNLNLPYPSDLPRQINVRFRDQNYLLEPHIMIANSKDILLISDIDDTTKKTDVPNTSEALKNIFLRPFEEIAGMPALYQQFIKDNNNQIAYVTGAPWQLYPPTLDFLTNKGLTYPQELYMSTKIPSNIVTIPDIISDKEAYKNETITQIITTLNHQGEIILVGDEGQKDPEVYNYINKNFPSQVTSIFIRVLDGSLNEKEQRVLDRFEESFRSKVFTFSTGDQILKYLKI